MVVLDMVNRVSCVKIPVAQIQNTKYSSLADEERLYADGLIYNLSLPFNYQSFNLSSMVKYSVQR